MSGQGHLRLGIGLRLNDAVADCRGFLQRRLSPDSSKSRSSRLEVTVVSAVAAVEIKFRVSVADDVFDHAFLGELQVETICRVLYLAFLPMSSPRAFTASTCRIAPFSSVTIAGPASIDNVSRLNFDQSSSHTFDSASL